MGTTWLYAGCLFTLLLLVQQSSSAFYPAYDEFYANVISVGALSGAVTGFALSKLSGGKNGIEKCEMDTCGPNGKCLQFGMDPLCLCDPGFEGTDTCEPDGCSANPCGANGDCVLTRDNPSRYTCNCEAGFQFDGTTCSNDACSGSPCGDDGTCVLSNDAANGYVCKCSPGFRCNGITCIPDACDGSPCGDDGTCILSNDAPNGFVCQCSLGNQFNDITCVPDACNVNPCGNGFCVANANVYACICNPGFRFDGTSCQQECPIGTVEFAYNLGKICYYAVYSRQNRDDSVTICQNAYDEGDLAPIPNQEAQDFVSGIFFAFRDGNQDVFWISANDKRSENVFRDVISGHDPIGYVNWGTIPVQQPDNNNNEDCVVIFPNRDYTWYDRRCTNNYQALCSVNIDL